MYKLYWSKRTGAFAAETALELCGAAFEGVQVDHKAGAHREAAYLAINPAGQIPALVLPDGQLMTESAAMLLHLVDAYPDSGYWPTETSKRAVAYRWLVFASAQLYETDLRYSYAARYTTAPDGAEGVRQAAHRHIDHLWTIVAEALTPGPFFFGENLTLLDSYVAMVAAWHYDLPRLCAAEPRVHALLDAVTAHPAVGPIWRRYELPMPALAA